MPAATPPASALVDAYLREIANAYGLRLPGDDAVPEPLQTTAETVPSAGPPTAAASSANPGPSPTKDSDFDVSGRFDMRRRLSPSIQALQARFSALKKR